MTDEPGDQRPAEEKRMPQHGPAQPVDRDEATKDPMPRHTPGGAPTNAAHQDAGDGALTGSVPAGLTIEELSKSARESGRDDSGTD